MVLSIIKNCDIFTNYTYDGANGKGLLGWNRSSGIVTNCYYYDTDVAGGTDTTGGSYPKGSAAMKMQINYSGWDFDNIWGIDEDVDDGYPYLQTEQSVFKRVKDITLKCKITVN